MTAVYVKSCTVPPPDVREVLRYAGVRQDVADMEALARSCFDEARGGLSYRVCYAELALEHTEPDEPGLGFARVRSASLKERLMGCDRVVVFVATLGLAHDRLITRYMTRTPSRALMLDALGAERVEALCDAFCKELAADAASRGYACRPRFSPGYGDLPLSLQRDIIRLLDTPRRIGVSLGESLLMTPTKSVSAIVGLATAENTEKV